MGCGTSGQPIIISGDASGGPDSSISKFRRVGLAIAKFTSLELRVLMEFSAHGPVTGPRQVVARGEIRAFVLAVWATTGSLTYITDYEPLVQSWYERAYERPKGDDGDLWVMLADLLRERDPASISVLFTHSHQNQYDIVEGRAVRSLVLANTVADELADHAALRARLPDGDRHRVQRHEARARKVRLRLLRASLDCLDAETEQAAMKRREKKESGAPEVPPPPPPPRPPPAAAVAQLMSRHSLDESKRKCLRCFGSASVATATEWTEAPCPQLVNVDGTLWSPSTGSRIHVSGGWLHSSHLLNYHTVLKFWFCGRCGGVADKQLRSLGQPCSPITPTGRVYLDRIRDGLNPKVSSRAEQLRRQQRVSI